MWDTRIDVRSLSDKAFKKFKEEHENKIAKLKGLDLTDY